MNNNTMNPLFTSVAGKFIEELTITELEELAREAGRQAREKLSRSHAPAWECRVSFPRASVGMPWKALRERNAGAWERDKVGWIR